MTDNFPSENSPRVARPISIFTDIGAADSEHDTPVTESEYTSSGACDQNWWGCCHTRRWSRHIQSLIYVNMAAITENIDFEMNKIYGMY